jgi:uncharacterized membrane protein
MEVITHRKHGNNISEWERVASAFLGSSLVACGLIRRTEGTLAGAAMGLELLRRGITGHSFLYEVLGVRTAGKGQGAETTSVPYELGLRVDHSITVNKPRAEVYRFWRNLENLPRFMNHLQSVRQLDHRRSHWVANAPAGRTAEWDAEIINEIENELLGFRSLEGSTVDLAGSVQFKDAPDGRGTELIVELQYNPPAGILGAFAAKMYGEEPTQQLEEDLRRFKAVMEGGEMVTTEGQPKGGEAAAGTQRKRDEVTRASEESFPASDAPAWKL